MSDGRYQVLLDSLREKHGVVGATLGVLADGAVQTAASGLLNLDTKVECTPDSVFQIGSIGKIFTTTLVMQLVDAGRIALDDPVIKHLRDFAIADLSAARSITLRQLLNHTSGMDGDFFPADDPEGPSTASYVRKMALLPNLYPPGEGPVTYCNCGFVTAGRIVEKLAGMTWQHAVMANIARPLKLRHAFAHPHESLRFRCAMGHVAEPTDMKKIRTAPATYLSLSAAAAGSVLSMSVDDLLTFAKVHMADGDIGEDRTLLSESAARRMREDLTPIPPFGPAGVSHYGLGWFIGNAQDYGMAGHDGGTLGQYTYLRTFPRKRIAFALFTNSPSLKLFEEINANLTQSLLGVEVPKEPPAHGFKVQSSRYVGRYANIATDYFVEASEAGLSVGATSKVGLPEVKAALEPYCEDVFVLRAEGTPFDGQKVSFLEEDEEGKSKFIRMGLRMGRRAP
jgi:CubicO group peptidase (beta-lactamase class C family)